MREEGATLTRKGAVKPHTQALAEEAGARFDIADIGGQRDHAINQDGHPAGLTIDIMTHNGRSLGQQIASYLLPHAQRLSVDYVIWQQAIWRAADPAAGWAAMVDRGTPSAYHLDHLHVNLPPLKPRHRRPDPDAVHGHKRGQRWASRRV